MRSIVIGSGIAGSAVAYRLARAGVDVVVADAAHPGTATAAGAGIVSPWTSRRPDDGSFAFAARAAVHYRTLVEELAEDGFGESSFQVVGGMVVSADEGELADVQARITARAAECPEAGTVRLLEPREARELFPVLAPDLGAVHVSGAARVDGRVMRRVLLDAAVHRGARVVDGRAELVTVGDRVTGVRVDGTLWESDVVVVAAGAWSAGLLDAIGVRLPVEPQRGQISHVELPGTDTSAWPVVLPMSGHYLLAFPGSRVVAGATREDGTGFDHRVTAAGQREVLDEALRVAPGLAGATLLETRVGFRPATPDGLPVLGEVEPYAGLVVATGFGPTGLTLAPFAGSVVADVALGQAPPADIAAFAPGRFPGMARA